MVKKRNKFDPAPESPKHEVETCTTPLSDNEEAFLVFCRRAFGTSANAPLVFAGEAMNGATIGNMAEAFAICRGLGKQAPARGAQVPDGIGLRREALENS